jgi:hypothetical protein
MYINPLLLPQFTNREDLLLTISLNDDDTGLPINLAGITLVNPNGFTGSSWKVTDGSIITSSTTPLTIPGYPIGSQLSTLSLTVGTNLGIKPGDPITIADNTGLNTMTGYVVSYASTGALICQIGLTFQFEIRRGRPGDAGTGYVTWYDFGVQNDQGPLLAAALGTGITITDVGFIQILLPEAQFKTLSHGPTTYAAALTMTDSVNTRQIFLAQLPVFSGGVTN